MAVFTNQATLAYNDTVTNSNITTGELLEVLSVTKSALTPVYGAGGDVTYVVSIRNSGPTPLSGLTVTDDLGGYAVGAATVYPLEYRAGSLLYYVNGLLQTTPAVTAGPPLTVTGITVPAGGNAIVIYGASVTRYAPLAAESTIDNTVTVTGTGGESATATETVTADNGPVLTITKSLCPATVTENGQLTYTFVIQNTGNTPAVTTDNAVVTDTFDPALSDLVVTFNGETWTEPADYTYDAAAGAFATVAGQITVPAATYTQDPDTGLWSVTPGFSVLTVTGTV